MSESYQFIESFGYYYFTENQDSISNTWNNPEKANEIINYVLTIKQKCFKPKPNFYKKFEYNNSENTSIIFECEDSFFQNA